MKIILYYGEDGAAAKKHANFLRVDGVAVNIISSEMAVYAEQCDRVVVMPDVPKWRCDAIEKLYGEGVNIKFMPRPEPPPVEASDPVEWTGEMTYSKEVAEVPTEPLKRKRGRPRKYPDGELH